VRQKPQLKAGELQFHADGAIKCTWPAYLPSHNIKPDWAIYGNTASFIIDRFDNGHVSASAANCEYVLVMVLDDVGDPEKAPNTPTVPPTWIIETSEGSYQWGYTFSEQPTKGEYAAAIRAVADAGYTDPGACNPVRNFRLPGSINLKPNKNRFAARLVEFHPEREYTLSELCAGLNVTPAPADSLTLRPIRLSDDGADDVMAWLSGQGLLFGLPKRTDGRISFALTVPSTPMAIQRPLQPRHASISAAYIRIASISTRIRSSIGSPRRAARSTRQACVMSCWPP
jgi:hypothetical protein